jgi:hypothetical protein
LPQNSARFVNVERMVIVKLVPPQPSLAVGGVNVHAVPHSTVEAGAQINVG